ncbi:MAG: glycosyltransferase family 8 protein [Candidatus Gastranaerophilaceae bacterium]
MDTTDEIIPVFLASDENYAPCCGTTIFSIIKNTNSFVNFYILDGGISKESKKKLNLMMRKFNNFSIEFIDMSNFYLNRFPNIKHYSVNAFSRYFIPEIKPNLDKVLYLDVDIIVKGDISELYNENLDNYPLGTILEDFCDANSAYLKKIAPSFASGKRYFNSGVLLIDCKKFRASNYTQILVDKTIELFDVLSCPDQDVFNIVFENNYRELPYKYNFMPGYADNLLKLNKKTGNDAIKNHLIIHYTYGKPWIDPECISAAEFWEVAVKTPFFEQLKKGLRKSVFRFYLFGFIPILKIAREHLFNEVKYYLFGFLPILQTKKR